MKRLNFRVGDGVRDSIDRIFNDLRTQDEQVTFSEVARYVMEEGLRSIARGEGEPQQADKGGDFEKWCAAELQQLLPGLTVERLRPKPGRRNPDILTPFMAVECKAGRRPSTRQALEQAIDADRDDRIPVAIIKDDDREAFVVMKFSDFKAFLRLVGGVWRFFCATKTEKHPPPL